jgi:membrane-associated protein
VLTPNRVFPYNRIIAQNRAFLFFSMNFSILLQPELLINTAGLAGVCAVLFAESGLFFGFFLPGDSLLFTAGVIASQGFLHFPLLLVCSFIAAVAGDNVGFWFGHKVGNKLFQKEDSLIFKKHHLIEAQKFYEKHGAKTILLARFVPFIRTFAPIVAGAADMDYAIFMRFNLVGGLLWAAGISSLGYFLGNIPVVRKNYEFVIFLIIFGSLVPIALHFISDQSCRKAIKQKIYKIFGKK